MLSLDKDHLEQDYTVESESASVLVLHTEDPGDSYRLEFRDATAGPGQIPKSTFTLSQWLIKCIGAID